MVSVHNWWYHTHLWCVKYRASYIVITPSLTDRCTLQCRLTVTEPSEKGANKVNWSHFCMDFLCCYTSSFFEYLFIEPLELNNKSAPTFVSQILLAFELCLLLKDPK